VIGCLVAVLAVQQSGLFTAIIQPPLVLFVTVPGAYFLMHSSQIEGVKDILINCGYPLIERFPLMFFTSAVVLLIGLARWYFGKSAHPGPAEEASEAPLGGLSSKLSGLFAGRRRSDADEDEPRPRRASDRQRTRERKPAADRAARGERPTKRAAPRSRPSRAAETEIIEPVRDDERPRRRRERPSDQSEPRRRPRSSSRQPRDSAARERDPMPPRERRARYDRDDRYERPRRERPQRRSRYDDQEPSDPYGSSGSSSHHPISRVRYRGEDSDDRSEYRPRRRASREAEADRWEYDI